MDSNFDEERTSEKKENHPLSPLIILVTLLLVGYLGVAKLDSKIITNSPDRHLSTASVILANSVSEDPCSAPGVSCTYDRKTPVPVGDCVNPSSAGVFLNCKHQRTIAERQVTSGVGKPAPIIERLEYTSQQCLIVTTVGSGQCYEEASEKCATAHANEVTECFWNDCPGSCSDKTPLVSGVSSGDNSNSVDEIIEDLSGDDPSAPFRRSDGSTDIAACAAAGVCEVVASNSASNFATDAVFAEDLLGVSRVISDDVTSQITKDFSHTYVPESTSDIGGISRTATLESRVEIPTRDWWQGGSLISARTQQVSSLGAEPIAMETGTAENDSTQNAPSTESEAPTTRSRSTAQPLNFVETFVAAGNVLDRFAGFITGQTITRAAQAPVTTTEVASTENTGNRVENRAETGEEYRNIQTIASDIASQKRGENKVSRVDQFAQTLTLVGGPNAASTENKSFGRIQDLIVEDEAIRSLRLAEEEGKRAKNSTYCRAFETSESCLERRVARAKVVEREVFVTELERRVLPENAIQHFIAVYDGWIRPTPAPGVRATSTLGLLNTEDNNLEDYEVTTDGRSFVSWIIDSVTEAASDAISALANLITGSETAFEEEVSN